MKINEHLKQSKNQLLFIKRKLLAMQIDIPLSKVLHFVYFKLNLSHKYHENAFIAILILIKAQ